MGAKAENAEVSANNGPCGLRRMVTTAKAKRVDKLLAAIERLLRNAAAEKKKFSDITTLGQEAIAARYKAAGLQKPRRQSAKVGKPGFRLVF